MSHTPGPWTVVDKGHGFSIEPSICWLGSSSAHNPGENEANARLIAAAPEMLEVLKKFIDFRHSDYVPNALFDAAIYVIKKAEGE